MKQRPTGIAVLAILDFLGAAIAVAGSMVFMVSPKFVMDHMDEYPAGIEAFLPIGGIVLLVIALLYGLVGYGLWRLRNWARITTLVLSVLEAVGQAIEAVAALAQASLLAVVESAFVGGICGLVIWYLIQPHVKQAFAKSPPRRAAFGQ